MTFTNKTIGVLFDLDGVLVDSESEYSKFWSSIDRKYPTGIANFDYVIKGTTLTKILNNNFPTELHAEIVEALYEFEGQMPYPIMPGVMDFITELKQRGIPSAIVTSSDKAKMAKVFAQHPDFKSYFNFIIDASMITKSKPDPEGYLLGASKIGVAPENCYIFEDSRQGLAAGMASGATVIGLATTLRRKDINGKAHKIIDSFTGFTVDSMLSVSKL